MSEPAILRASSVRRWPMTGDAWRSLVDELGQRRERLSALESAAHDEGGIDLISVMARRRFESLSAVLDAAEQVDGAHDAVIGSRVTLVDEDGASATYVLACPGEGDPSRGWIAADSPIGRAVLSARVGDRIEINAPAGRRVETVLSIEERTYAPLHGSDR